MNLPLSCFLLFAALLLSSSAPTPEECKALVSPVSLADPSVLYGRQNFLVGYTDHELFKAMLNVTDSSWLNMTASPSGPTKLSMSQNNRINGSCFGSAATVTVDGDSVTAAVPNVTSVFQLLPSCDGCLVFRINSTATNLQQWLDLMKIDKTAGVGEVHAQSLYFLSKETTVKDSDLENFKKQASCLGFSGELDFLYNPEKSFCQEGEGFRLVFS